MDVSRLQQRLADLVQRVGNKRVKVGIYGGITTNDGQSMAAIATFNEFGTANIPARSFMRFTINQNIDVYKGIMAQMLNSVVSQRYTIDEGLGRLGAKVRDDIKATVVSITSPANAESTIRQKGSSNPLIDTGAMLNSIEYAVDQ